MNLSRKWLNEFVTVEMIEEIAAEKERASREANEKKKAAEEKGNGYQPVNPYKEAKRTGKSVEEIVEKENRKKEKAARKAARDAEEDEDDDDDYEPYVPEGHYRVKTLRTVASGGSTYITGRKAAAEERAAREARYAKNAKKGKKGKKKSILDKITDTVTGSK